MITADKLVQGVTSGKFSFSRALVRVFHLGVSFLEVVGWWFCVVLGWPRGMLALEPLAMGSSAGQS